MHADLAVVVIAHVGNEVARVDVGAGQVLGEREHGPIVVRLMIGGRVTVASIAEHNNATFVTAAAARVADAAVHE